uniref:Beta-lactamase-related domain-containing protein n=1 Tax=Acrobeloides nanus TaxID=290746 RepID=A0A914D8Z3_9BILA
MVDNIFGHCDPRFSKVEEVFRRNFQEGWEYEGAAFAVYHKGKLVVDLQGGYADSSSLAKWTDKTRTIVFSVTKSVGALCIALLVDRGYINYEDKLSGFWPKYAQNGKEDTTVEMVVNHQAGLPAFDGPFSFEDAQNPDRVSEIIESQTPLWKPGTKSGYHALTYGWLVDQIIRRVDPKKRSVGQFFREEIAEKHNIDFFIGLPPAEEYTVSRLATPSFSLLLREIWQQPALLVMLGMMTLAKKLGWGYPQVWTFPSWFNLSDKKITTNNPEFHFMEQAAALGITRAKDLAKLFALVIKGEIVSPKLVERFYEPMIKEKDVVMGFEAPKGLGFMYSPNPKKPGKYLFGHPGYGGNNVAVDPEEELVIAYVTNGIKVGYGDLTHTFNRLKNAVFDIVEQFGKETGKDAASTQLLGS